jgi:alpha-L-fucosidase
MNLFSHPRFGLFMHWGLYSLGGWHEQEIWRWPVSKNDYGKRLSQWNPSEFNAAEWVDFAEAAGMSYLCITAKHVEGFCLWPTKQTEFSVASTPNGRDIVGELAEECHRRDFGFCIYYSIPDMHHPAYPHAGNPYELAESRPDETPDKSGYIDFLMAQVEELCTWYGQVDAFWWDANVQHWDLPKVNARIRELQPGIRINNRGFDTGDFATPERDWDSSVNKVSAFSNPTEACQSIGVYSWGAKKDDEYYTPVYLERSIAKIMAKGGNYLLNVGPAAEGRIPAAGQRIVGEVGRWFCRVAAAFVGTTPLPVAELPPRVTATAGEQSLYLIWFRPAATDGLFLRAVRTNPTRVTILNTGTPAEWVRDRLPAYGPGKDPEPTFRLVNLPVDVLSREVLVVKLEFPASVEESVSVSTDGVGADGPPPEFMAGGADE